MAKKIEQIRLCDGCGRDVKTFLPEPTPCYCYRCCGRGTHQFPESVGRKSLPLIEDLKIPNPPEDQ